MKHLLLRGAVMLLPRPSQWLISTLSSFNCHPSLLSFLENCTRPNHLYEIHAQTIVSGVIQDTFVATKLAESFTNVRIPKIAYNAFQMVNVMEKARPFTWNIVLRCYQEMNDPVKVIWVYSYMRRKGVRMDSFTAQFLIKACMSLSRSFEGKMVHGHILQLGFNSELIIETTIVRMYSYFGDINCAQKMFNEMTVRDVVSWNAVISACAQRGHPVEALRLSSAMLNGDIRPNDITTVSMLSACCSLGRLNLGMMVHGYVIRNIVYMDVFVYNSLIGMYCNCGKLSTARFLFERMHERNVVSWTTLINGYAQTNSFSYVVYLLKEMESNNVELDQVAVLGIVSACSKLESYLLAEVIHNYVNKKGFMNNSIIICNAVIDMLAKCGNLEKACMVFNAMRKRTTVSWSAMIQGLAIHGFGRDAFIRFVQMLRQGFAPDNIVLLVVLQGCSHAGMVDEGLKCFNSMVQQHRVVPTLQHYGCVVDLLCRAGLVTKAFEFVELMPIKPDAVIWRTLLAACKDHGHHALMRKFFSLLVETEPTNSQNYLILSNACAAFEQWDKVMELRVDIGVSGAFKNNPGCSMIQV